MAETVEVHMTFEDGGIHGDLEVDISSLCLVCAHRGLNIACDAFPQGIPDEILSGKFDHTKPYKGDNGIMFKKLGG